ncbi:MAG TPA: hypothetical protein VGB18_07000, partial [Candidatus Thermoplasmatota archaeon]
WVFGGGAETWFFTTGVQSEVVVFEKTVWNSGFSAVAEQGGRVLVYLEPEVGILIAAAVALVVAFWFRRSDAVSPLAKPLIFSVVWVGPSLLFMALVFSGWERGPRGYALVFLPAFYVLLGIGVATAMDAHLPRLRDPSRRVAAIALACALLVSPIPFLNAEREELIVPAVDDRNTWGTGWLGLKEAFPSNGTAILTSHEWGFARWYFPDYIVWGYLPGTTHPDWNLAAWHFVLEAKDRKDEAPLYGVYRAGSPPREHVIPDGVTRIVLTDFAMAGENGHRALLEDVIVKESILPNGWRVLYFDVDPSRNAIEAYLLPLGTG